MQTILTVNHLLSKVNKGISLVRDKCVVHRKQIQTTNWECKLSRWYQDWIAKRLINLVTTQIKYINELIYQHDFAFRVGVCAREWRSQQRHSHSKTLAPELIWNHQTTRSDPHKMTCWLDRGQISRLGALRLIIFWVIIPMLMVLLCFATKSHTHISIGRSSHL